ncbi:unnamed protein product [Penicillium olsonii]|nr:unnamed protein product [Penicillium olsonii]
MLMMHSAWLIILFAAFVKADDDWDDFTNNLATDLAPLITLFGERLTKQFLSESISALDNVIFALSPLGVLTAVVSVIRICGSSSLRAFVGRAQEGPAEAESELLPCVSESTAELFNDGGVARVFGRPKIMEIVSWEENHNNDGTTTRMGTMKEALEQGAWSCKGKTAPSELPELDIPNLSLNKGIKRRGQGWFYCAAVLGVVLQSGTIIYAALTVFVFPQHFKKDDKAVASYAFPFYFIGTTLLFIGMFFCAFIMERSSKEFYLKPEKPSTIYWVQPGNQDVGDQAFNAFLAVKDDPDEYIKSVRDRRFDRKYMEIYSTLASTLLGFILQFVGLRGLHASVILAQLGSTFLMAIIRTCLRTERMAPGENKMRGDRELTSDKKQELDCFAFHLENMHSFDLVPLPDRPANMPSPRFTPHVGSPLAKQIIRTRVQLAKLTSNSNQSLNVNWNDMPIRQVARKLAKAIESTMDLMNNWDVEFGTTYEFRLAFKCQQADSKSKLEPPGTYSIGLMRCGDVLRWKIDPNELEAVLGLWVWSLHKSNKHWRKSKFCRLVGLDVNEASLEETYLYFHKWIFRQTEVRFTSADALDYPQQLFIPESEDDLSEKTILTMSTTSSLECMAAHDIFVQFLKEAMINLKELGGEVDIEPGIRGSFLGSSTRINELVAEFENSRLGTREDALLCIVPVLKKRNFLPKLSADSPMIKKRIKTLVKQGKWETVFGLLRWICARSEGSELDDSLHELGFLCRHAVLSNNSLVRTEGAEQIYRLLKSEIRDEFFQTCRFPVPSNWKTSPYRRSFWGAFRAQLGWVAWEISKNDPEMKTIQDNLKNMAVQEALFNIHDPNHETEDLKTATRVLKHWLTIDHDCEGGLSSVEDGDEICFDWTIRNNHYALLYFLLLRMIELSPDFPDILQVAYSASIKYRSQWAVELLLRHQINIDIVDGGNHSALVQCIALNDLGGAHMLLDYGASANGAEVTRAPRPLIAAIETGNADMMELLLRYGASPHAFDKRGVTPMWWAGRSGETKLVEVLLRHGAPIDPAECYKTPLLFAAGEEQLDMLTFLIERGADLNTRDEHGHTALMSAAMTAKSEVVELLVRNGADVHMHNSKGLTALDMIREEHRNFVENIPYQQQHMSPGDLELAKKLESRCLHIIATLEQAGPHPALS